MMIAGRRKSDNAPGRGGARQNKTVKSSGKSLKIRGKNGTNRGNSERYAPANPQNEQEKAKKEEIRRGFALRSLQFRMIIRCRLQVDNDWKVKWGWKERIENLINYFMNGSKKTFFFLFFSSTFLI